jgi:hypothetical protein
MRSVSRLAAVENASACRTEARKTWLDFCGRHNITADAEVIPIRKGNDACRRLLKSGVKYRPAIDRESLKFEGPARRPKGESKCRSANWERAAWKCRLWASAAWA